MSSFRHIFALFLAGLTDSIRGLWIGLKVIYSCKKVEPGDETETKPKVLTILALRRMQGHREVPTPIVKRRKIINHPTTLVVKCILANVLLAAVFELFLKPLAQFIFFCFGMNMSWNSQIFAFFYLNISPVVFVRLLNSVWLIDLVKTILDDKKNASQRTRKFPFTAQIADVSFALIAEVLYAAQTFIVFLLPAYRIAIIINIFLLSILNALYCFEYIWVNRGIFANQRFAMVERLWPYFVGFGLPLTLASNWDNHVMNACSVGILFPLFVTSSCVKGPTGGFANKSIPHIPFFKTSRWLAHRIFSISTNFRSMFRPQVDE